MTKAAKATWNEDFARFFEDPTRDGFRKLLKDHSGETRNLDFKAAWPDFPDLAKHILGMANTEGGAIVVGVREDKTANTLVASGLISMTDKADLSKGLRKFLPGSLASTCETLDFNYSASEYDTLIGKSFQVMVIKSDPNHLPYVCMKDGGKATLRESAIYIRRGTETVEANHDELQKVINTRIETGYSTQREMDLDQHLGQLKTLTSKVAYIGGPFGGVPTYLQIFQGGPNPRLTESFDDFVFRMIDAKKRRIADELDVSQK